MLIMTTTMTTMMMTMMTTTMMTTMMNGLVINDRAGIGWLQKGLLACVVQADAVRCQFILSFQDDRNEVHEMHQGQDQAGNESNESSEGSGRTYEFHVGCSLKCKNVGNIIMLVDNPIALERAASTRRVLLGSTRAASTRRVLLGLKRAASTHRVLKGFISILWEAPVRTPEKTRRRHLVLEKDERQVQDRPVFQQVQHLGPLVVLRPVPCRSQKDSRVDAQYGVVARRQVVRGDDEQRKQVPMGGFSCVFRLTGLIQAITDRRVTR